MPQTNIATTRSTQGRPRPPHRLLDAGALIFSAESGVSYRIGRMLGEGGFGQVLPRPPRLADRPPSCRPRSASRSARVSDALAARGLLRPGRRTATRAPSASTTPSRCSAREPRARVLYCLVARVRLSTATSAPSSQRHPASDGREAGRPPRDRPASARSSGKLHRGQMLHRDLTPLNVFVCERRQLEARRLRHRPAAERPARRHGAARSTRTMVAERHFLAATAPEVADARRRVSGGAAARPCSSRATRRDRVTPRPRFAYLAVQRSPEGDRATAASASAASATRRADELIAALHAGLRRPRSRAGAAQSLKKACTSRSPAS